MDQGGDQQKYSWHVPPFSREAFLEHWQEILEHRDRELDDNRTLFDQFSKVTELRIAFVDKLMLVNTGTIALSLTFLAALGTHSAAKFASRAFVWELYISWGLLVCSLLAGGLHNKRRTAIIELLFARHATLRSRYRTEDRARQFSQTASFLKGTIEPNDSQSGEEPLDMGALFEAANSYMKQVAQKSTAASVSREQELGAELANQAKLAARLEFACVSLTAVALLFLVGAVMQVAWIFLQR